MITLRHMHVALVDVLKAYASQPAMLLLAFGIIMIAVDVWLLVSLTGR